jgi:hypothetical protein
MQIHDLIFATITDYHKERAMPSLYAVFNERTNTRIDLLLHELSHFDGSHENKAKETEII